ncbi:hypothetical protein GOP47_0003408 [Adiantum capillus-veneris]|uniref:Uncharacterized protein n=1 Tax=Adiantum capillus-veneris TaxID=13818 RepID=A0A9D4ZSI0_ADICA|nr:hypothetical protein GOP47_0003408 [Adiantum capillus-veneris]
MLSFIWQAKNASMFDKRVFPKREREREKERRGANCNIIGQGAKCFYSITYLRAWGSPLIVAGAGADFDIAGAEVPAAGTAELVGAGARKLAGREHVPLPMSLHVRLQARRRRGHLALLIHGSHEVGPQLAAHPLCRRYTLRGNPGVCDDRMSSYNQCH